MSLSTLRVVDRFSRAFDGAMPALGANNAAVNSQQVMVNNIAAVRAASPMEVQLPMSGKVYLLEKILVVEDTQWFSYKFTRLRK